MDLDEMLRETEADTEGLEDILDGELVGEDDDGLGFLNDLDEAPMSNKKASKKKASKKKAAKPAAKPAAPEQVEAPLKQRQTRKPKAETASAPIKQRRTRTVKPKTDNPLDALTQELSAISGAIQDSSQVDLLKIELRTAKATFTQLNRFHAKVTKACELAEKRIAALTAKIEG